MNTVFINDDIVDMYINGSNVDDCISLYVDVLNCRLEKKEPPFIVEVYKRVGQIKFTNDPDEGYCYTVAKTNDT